MWANAYRHRAFVLLFAAVIVAPAAIQAQEKKEEPKDANDPVQVLPWVVTEVGQNTCAWIANLGAVSPLGSTQPWGVVGTRLLAGHEDRGIPQWKFVFTEAFPLPQDMLDATRDGQPLPKVLYADYKKLKGFYPLLCRAVERTQESTLDMFKTSAEEFKHVHYADLKATPGRYRGKVITVKGTLKNVRKVDTFRLVAEEIRTAMPHVYTGWVLGPGKNLPPFTVVFTDLPPEIAEPNENLDVPVTFYGYFLAFINYPADPGSRQKGMISPYLVGKTLVVQPPGQKAEVVPPVQDEDSTPVSAVLIAYSVGGIVAVVLLGALLNVWLRRGDRKIQARLADMRDRQQPFKLEPADEAPGTPPAAFPDMDHGVQGEESKTPPA